MKRPPPMRCHSRVASWSDGILAFGLLLVLFTALAAASATLVSAAPSTPQARQQRVAIEQKLRLDARAGAFVLYVLTPGTLEDDWGTFAHRDVVQRGRIRGGQGVATYVLLTEFSGKRGTFFARERLEFVAAGNGYVVGTGRWSVIGGSGAYAQMAGSGHEGSVLTAGGLALSQSEGLVSSFEP